MNNDETNKILKDILKWQRLQGMQILRDLLPKSLDTPDKESVYEMTDGENRIKDIQKKIKIATGTVHAWWNLWLAQGIITKEGTKYRKLISLKELGIEIKTLKKQKEKESDKQKDNK